MVTSSWARFIFSSVLFIALGSFATGQVQLQYDNQETFGRKLGRTGEIRHKLMAAQTDSSLMAAYKANRPVVSRNFENSRPTRAIQSGALPVGPDPLVQDMSGKNPWRPSDPLFITEALSRKETFAGVPDVNGDVSDNYYVQTVNASVIQVFDRNGEPIGEPFSSNVFWEDLGFTAAGDPIVLFDHEAGRWFFAEFPFGNYMLMAISDDEDPLGNYTAFALNTPSFPDYPKYAIWPDAYVLTVNELGGDDLIFYTINREDLLTGVDTFRSQRHAIFRLDQPGVQSASPVGWIGDSLPPDDVKPMVMRINDDGWGNTDEDRIELYEVDTDWDNPDSSKVREILLPTTPFNAEFCEDTANIYVCVPQPGNPFISAIPRIIWHRASYRHFGDHGSIVLNFGVDATGERDGGIRWMELRKENTSDWQVYQEGTIGSSDGMNRFLGGISIDGAGNIGIAYAISSEAIYPSLRFTGRMANDPLGMMTLAERGIAGGFDISSTPRYGDYFSMSVDRQDRFWFTGQYIRPGGIWGTKVMSFKVLRDSVDLGVMEISNVVTDTVSVRVHNWGTAAQDSFSIGLMLDGELIKMDTVKVDPLAMDEEYIHEFTDGIPVSQPGYYKFEAFVIAPDDTNPVNDTSSRDWAVQGEYDALPMFLAMESIACTSQVSSRLYFRNRGTEILTSLQVELLINGSPVDSISWEGVIESPYLDTLHLQLSDLQPGENDIMVITSLPNGMPDQVPSNDTLRKTITIFDGGQPAQFELTTDLFPESTFWELLDSNGNMIQSGGMYDIEANSYLESWCLDSNQCYQFILYDLDSNGISAFGVDGDFRIMNSDGIVVASLGSPFFEYADTTDFCMDYECTLAVNRATSNETIPGASNGIINMFATNGSAPYMFSIDGGMTFQTTSFFTGLAPGVYNCLVRDDINCEVSFQITILDCDIAVMAEVTDASSSEAQDGSILLEAIGGRGSLRYSINGGSTFQTEPLFENLAPDTFAIQVRDSVNCRTVDTVEVSFASSIETTTHGHLIKVFPNPSNGVYFAEVHGLTATLFAKFDIIDATGKVIQSGEAGSFDGVLKAAFSIRSSPDGVYYLRFRHPSLTTLVRLVKTGQ